MEEEEEVFVPFSMEDMGFDDVSALAEEDHDDDHPVIATSIEATDNDDNDDEAAKYAAAAAAAAELDREMSPPADFFADFTEISPPHSPPETEKVVGEEEKSIQSFSKIVDGVIVLMSEEEFEEKRIEEEEQAKIQEEILRIKKEERDRYVADRCTTLKFRYMNPINKGSLENFLGTRDREVVLEDRILSSYADLQVEIAKFHPNSKHLFVCQYMDGTFLSSENFTPVNVYKVREAPLSDAAYEQLSSSFSYARLPTMWEVNTYSGWPKPKTEEAVIEKPKSEVENILGDLLGNGGAKNKGNKTRRDPKDKMTIKGATGGGVNPSRGREAHQPPPTNEKGKTSPQRQRDLARKK